MAVYSYVRVSTLRQVEEGLSLEVQRRQVKGYAQLHGLALERVFVEGVSGSVPLGERPAGAALMAILRPGHAVIAAKLDRAFRSALDALQVVRTFTERRIGLHLLDVGGNLSNGHGKLFMTIVAAFAEAERDQRERGRFLGGKRPIGYRVAPDGKLAENTQEQAALATARELRARGLSLRKISAALAEQGTAISRATLHRALADRGHPACP